MTAQTGPNAVQRFARNSLVPIATQLINKTVDLGFAFAMLRILGPGGSGSYDVAVLIWTYAKTFTDFGLQQLTIRDVAQRPTLAGEYLGLTTLLRLILWFVTFPIASGIAFGYWHWFNLSAAGALAMILLVLSIVPDSYSDAANSICTAFERMESPAALTVIKNVLKVAIALPLLLAGWGVIGLAVTALIVNLLTAGCFAFLVRRLGVHAVWRRPGPEARGLLVESWPLLINNLLIGLFFRVDTLVLQPARGSVEVGIYNMPYKFLNLLLLIPQYGTLALFPYLSRLAASHAEALTRTYALAVKLLLALALPICVATTFVAPELMDVLGGGQFLPGAGTALRILIWFLPFSYVNGLTQYVLIAAGWQRTITRAFALTFVFNITANLLFTPRYGYYAAAVITVCSEIVLLLPFLWFLHSRVGRLPAAAVALRPLAGALVMGAAGWVVLRGAASAAGGFAPWLAVIVGGLGYLLLLIVTGGIGPAERRLALRLLGRVA
jgi:O-antigen/teichoic acid export membrane protein